MMKKWIACYLVLAMVMIGVVSPAQASFFSSEALTPPTSDRAGDLLTVQAVIESKLVSQRLADLGFTAEEVGARIAQLNNEQIHQMAQNLDQLRVGQDGGVVIGILVIIGLGVLIYYLLTHKIVIQ